MPYFGPRPVVEKADYFTRRQKSILRCLVRGMSNKEIGYELGITYLTTKMYMSRIQRQVKVGSRVEMALWAFSRQYLLEDEPVDLCVPEGAD